MSAPGEDRGRPLRLKTRPLFVRAAGGRKVHTALFTLQARARPDGEADVPRIGFTVTKKTGGAVERNRIRRRLREAVRTAPGLPLDPAHDYVVVARRAVLDAPFPALASGLEFALKKAHGANAARRSARAGDRDGANPLAAPDE